PNLQGFWTNHSQTPSNRETLARMPYILRPLAKQNWLVMEHQLPAGLASTADRLPQKSIPLLRRGQFAVPSNTVRPKNRQRKRRLRPAQAHYRQECGVLLPHGYHRWHPPAKYFPLYLAAQQETTNRLTDASL